MVYRTPGAALPHFGNCIFFSFTLEFHDFNNEQYSTVARHLTALKVTSDTLSACFSAVKSSPDSAEFFHPLFQRTSQPLLPHQSAASPIYISHLPIPKSPSLSLVQMSRCRSPTKSSSRGRTFPFQRTWSANLHQIYTQMVCGARVCPLNWILLLTDSDTHLARFFPRSLSRSSHPSWL